MAGKGSDGLADAVQPGLFFAPLLQCQFNDLVDTFVTAFGLFLHVLQAGFVGQSACSGLPDIRGNALNGKLGQDILGWCALQCFELFFPPVSPGIFLFDRLWLGGFPLFWRCLGCLAGFEQFLDERGHKSILGC